MSNANRFLLSIAAAFLLAVATTHAWSQDSWPSRTVRIISPYAAGGPNDISARILAEQLGRRLGQKFIVENKSGAATRLANETVARAPGDGYTLLYAAGPFATVEALYSKLSYDPHKDFQPIALCMVVPVFLIVNAEAPYKTLQQFIAYGKSNPNGLTFASPGAGSGPHLSIELLLRQADVKGLVVHFRGDAPAYTELLAKRVDATLTAISTALPYIQSGKLRVLGVASETHSAVYPQAPTLAEQGLSNVVGYGWYGLLAPAATPRPIIERLQKEVNEVLADPAVKKKLLDLGMEPRGGTPAEFAAFIQGETNKWGEVIRKANIKAE